MKDAEVWEEHTKVACMGLGESERREYMENHG